jgi:vancomycin resistance protein VanJ
MSAEAAASRAAPRSASVGFAVGLFTLWGIGQIARDRTLPTAWLFYLPTALVAGSLLLFAAGQAVRGRGRRAALVLLLGLPPAAVVLLLENHWQRPPEASASAAGAVAADRAGGESAARAADLRVAAWNVQDFPRGVERAAALLRPLDLDLIVLSEAPGKPPKELERHLASELRMTPIGSMALLVRGEVLDLEWLERDREAQVAFVRWAIAGRTLGILAVNLISSPRVPRDPLLRRVVGMIAERSPDLVLGDFNAPRRSSALARLPVGFRHAYDAGGSGWSATWPSTLPLLAIDQTIVGPRLRVRDYRLRTTRLSDHRLQLTELDFRMPPAGGSG